MRQENTGQIVALIPPQSYASDGKAALYPVFGNDGVPVFSLNPKEELDAPKKGKKQTGDNLFGE